MQMSDTKNCHQGQATNCHGLSLLLQGRRSAWLLLLALLTPIASADPVPFRAVYKAKYQGVPISVEGVRELKRNEDGSYEFTSSAKALIASIRETVTFEMVSDTPVPREYIYKRTGFGRNKTIELAFDWQRGLIANVADDNPWQVTVANPTWDKLSYQYKMRHDFSAARLAGDPWPELDYQVVDDGELDNYRFRVTGEEAIETNSGTFATIRVERVRDHNRRTSTFWLSPAHDFLLVRFVQTEQNGKGFSLLLKEAELAGVPVAGNAAELVADRAD